MKNVLKVGGVLMLVASAMSACDSGSGGPGNQGAYQQGSSNCSDQFVSDYNSVVMSMKYATSISDVDKAQSLVNDFSTKYQGVVCKAALHDDSHLDAAPSTIDASAKVTEWKGLIASARGQTTPNNNANSTPAPAAPAPIVSVSDPAREVTIASLTNGITLEVVDADAFNKFANTGHSVLIQKGKSATSYSIDRSADLCYLEMTSGAASFKKGDQVQFVTRVMSDKMEGVSTTPPIELGCIKLSNRYADWKLRDLDKVLDGVAKVISTN